MHPFYISFGQKHRHETASHKIDKDCIVQILAESREQAQKKAMKMFDGVFGMLYEEKPDMDFFPKGIIEL